MERIPCTFIHNVGLLKIGMLFLLDKLSKFDVKHIVYVGDMHHLVTSFPTNLAAKLVDRIVEPLMRFKWMCGKSCKLQQYIPWRCGIPPFVTNNYSMHI